MSRTQCCEWFKRLKRAECRSVKVPGLDELSTSTNDHHVERVRAVIRRNRRLTVREKLLTKWASAQDLVIKFLLKNFRGRRVSAKFVPRLLTNDQKENRVEIIQELLSNANGNENFLKNIITGDETQVYGYDVETKMQSSQWMGDGSRPKKKRG